MYCERCDSQLSGFEENICMNCAMSEVYTDVNYTQKTLESMLAREYTDEEIWNEIKEDSYIVTSQVKDFFDVQHFLTQQEAHTKEKIKGIQEKIEAFKKDAFLVHSSHTKQLISDSIENLTSLIVYHESELFTLKTKAQPFL